MRNFQLANNYKRPVSPQSGQEATYPSNDNDEGKPSAKALIRDSKNRLRAYAGVIGTIKHRMEHLALQSFSQRLLVLHEGVVRPHLWPYAGRFQLVDEYSMYPKPDFIEHQREWPVTSGRFG